MAKAKIICDSISESGIRLTTLELEFERFILPQFNTHRMFSRNAQSSRAIPTAKQIELIRYLPAPNFAQNKTGMQAGEKLSEIDERDAIRTWDSSKISTINSSERLLRIGVHKQWVNRLLEPFSTIKVVVTATEWDNFFKLRLHHDAQPEIQELAQAMKTAMDESTPVLLQSGEWHLPYITDDDRHCFGTDGRLFNTWKKNMPKISAARCARVSYLNHDNTNPDIEKDLELARHLLESGHLSPFEHQAKPMKYSVFEEYEGKVNMDCWIDGMTHIDGCLNCWSNNFLGWIQHRSLLQ